MLPLLVLLNTFFAGDSLPANRPVEPMPAIVHRMREARSFCIRSGYDTSVCFILDLAIPGGRNRFFVCDIAHQKVLTGGLVTHGGCNTRHESAALFSNEPGCGCSSSGKYRVGSFYKGNFGDAYKLIGLEASNSNAYSRNIVLHSHRCVPDAEVYPADICNSQGCTTVSPHFLLVLEKFISARRRPILLWVLPQAGPRNLSHL